MTPTARYAWLPKACSREEEEEEAAVREEEDDDLSDCQRCILYLDYH